MGKLIFTSLSPDGARKKVLHMKIYELGNICILWSIYCVMQRRKGGSCVAPRMTMIASSTSSTSIAALAYKSREPKVCEVMSHYLLNADWPCSHSDPVVQYSSSLEDTRSI